MSSTSELNEYRKFTKPAELHKAINTLKGIVAGITTDNIISNDEINELVHWCSCHSHLADRHPFNELIPLIESACEDNILDKSEVDDILWLCDNFVSDSCYYNLITSSIQFLNGLIYGILADGEITDTEIHSLHAWITDNEYLSGTYPFDEIESLLVSILADGIITDDERNMLKAFLGNFIDMTLSYNLTQKDFDNLRAKYSISGICAVCPEIDFVGSTFCFTGESSRTTRKEISALVESVGGIFKNSVTNRTKYLVVGNNGNPCWAFSCYGRKIEDAEKRRKQGQNLIIVNELDFWDALSNQ